MNKKVNSFNPTIVKIITYLTHGPELFKVAPFLFSWRLFLFFMVQLQIRPIFFLKMGVILGDGPFLLIWWKDWGDGNGKDVFFYLIGVGGGGHT